MTTYFFAGGHKGRPYGVDGSQTRSREPFRRSLNPRPVLQARLKWKAPSTTV